VSFFWPKGNSQCFINGSIFGEKWNFVRTHKVERPITITWFMLVHIFQSYKWRLIFIYTLNVIEEIGYLLIPASAGALINTFITGKGWGVLIFVINYLVWQGMATLRRILDSVIFTRIYNDVVIKTIEHHQQEGIEVGAINARMELLKQVVTFFEGDLPFLINSIFMMFGAAGLLFFYNTNLMWVCIIIIVPSLILNYFFGKKMVKVTHLVNNAYEKQLEMISTGDLAVIKKYLESVRDLNVRKSSLEAYNFGGLEIFVFLMILTSLYIICLTPHISYGDIVATYGYILRFAYSFDFIPHLTERMATIRDIQKRLQAVYA
jgi:ABC-type multidrug transport system fused ATPase/permease subunit